MIGERLSHFRLEERLGEGGVCEMLRTRAAGAPGRERA